MSQTQTPVEWLEVFLLPQIANDLTKRERYRDYFLRAKEMERDNAKGKKNMKAILEFDLNDPDDVMAHKRCVKALDMALALWDIQHGSFRREVYDEMEAGNMTDAEMQGAELVMTKLIEYLLDRGIDTTDFIQ